MDRNSAFIRLIKWEIPFVAAAILLPSLAIFTVVRGHGLHMDTGTSILIRVAIAAGSGFVATNRAHMSLRWSVAVGVFVFFVEQIGVFALWFALNGEANQALAVIKTFTVLCWVPALLGMVGGIAGMAWKH